MESTWPEESRIKQFFAGRRGRNLREYLAGYAMIAPALLLIFTFGLFPVAFALYVSLHKWVIVRGGFRGIGNYVAAVGSFAYIALFALSIGSIVGAALLLRRMRRQARTEEASPWLLAVPAFFHAAVVLAFLRWVFLELPEFLDIANKMRGLERTRELFTRLLSEAFHAETVIPAWRQFLLLFALSAALGLAGLWWKRSPRNLFYQANLAVAWLAGAVGAGLLVFTYVEIGKVYAAAVDTGVDPGVWPQVIVIASGLLLLVAAWRMWRSAEGEASNRRFALRILGAIVLMVGAVLLIVEIPTIVASGDKDLWNGLRVTVFFSLGTVPVQLAIALFLSVILFQKIPGSGLFRVLFFLPYVTPAVASATVFRLMFSERRTAPINRILGGLGIGAQRWLREPDGVLTMLANTLGISGYPQSLIPSWFPPDLASFLASWMSGPSQALMVVITLSVWTFVGYNTVIYLAGLGNIPAELTEAAEIDGASRWAVFRHVTFPLLSPTTYFLSLLGVMGTFKAFNTIWVLRTGQELGTIDTFSVAIFEQFFLRTRYGYASAMAFVLFAIILGLTYINSKVQGSRVFYG